MLIFLGLLFGLALYGYVFCMGYIIGAEDETMTEFFKRVWTECWYAHLLFISIPPIVLSFV